MTLDELREWFDLADVPVELTYRPRVDLPYLVRFDVGGGRALRVRGEGEDVVEALENALSRYILPDDYRRNGRAKAGHADPEPPDGLLENRVAALERWLEDLDRTAQVTYRVAHAPRWLVRLARGGGYTTGVGTTLDDAATAAYGALVGAAA